MGGVWIFSGTTHCWAKIDVGHSCDLKGEHQFFFKHQCKVCSLILVLSGRVIMVTKECHLPYDRPILSKVSVQLTILLS